MSMPSTSTSAVAVASRWRNRRLNPSKYACMRSGGICFVSDMSCSSVQRTHEHRQWRYRRAAVRKVDGSARNACKPRATSLGKLRVAVRQLIVAEGAEGTPEDAEEVQIPRLAALARDDSCGAVGQRGCGAATLPLSSRAQSRDLHLVPLHPQLKV